jgi:enoyl-CoA hydratase/carnithine racemase
VIWRLLTGNLKKIRANRWMREERTVAEETVEYETVIFEKDGGIGVLSFNRPDSMNAHNYKMKAEEQEVADRAARDDDVRVLIVTGRGRGFHAGEDIKEVFLGGDMDRMKADRRLAALGQRDEQAWNSQVHPKYFYGYPKPTIAAVNGPAVGGGFNIALSCDIRIASEQARFGYLYARRGLMGASRGLTTLLNLLGISRTIELALSDEIMDAQEALAVGLVRRVVPQDQLLDAAKEMARKLLRGAPLAHHAIKASLYKSMFEPDGIEDFNARVEAALLETRDHAEGARAFAEKREPRWAAR